MSTQELRHGDVALGLASGLAAGLVGALAMAGVQAVLARTNITSGVTGVPSTERAADRLSVFATGSQLSNLQRPIAGEAIRYAVGALAGAVYGAAAELEPRATAGAGSAFGTVAATIVDETLVPIFGLGHPVWSAPPLSHPYSFVSHLVFGTATEAARKVFRRFFGAVAVGAAQTRAHATLPRPSLADSGGTRMRNISIAFLLGATAGSRTSAPLTAVSWIARLGWIDLKGSWLRFIGSSAAAWMTTSMAVAELVADKLPTTPARTQTVGVVSRVASGALSAAALVGGRSLPVALAGAGGSVAATYLSYQIRKRVARAIGRDWPVAAVEDMAAFIGAAMVCLVALARTDPPGDCHV